MSCQESTCNHVSKNVSTEGDDTILNQLIEDFSATGEESELEKLNDAVHEKMTAINDRLVDSFFDMVDAESNMLVDRALDDLHKLSDKFVDDMLDVTCDEEADERSLTCDLEKLLSSHKTAVTAMFARALMRRLNN